MAIHIERVYGYSPSSQPAFLVDRLWPRGISKTDLDGVEWAKDVAPSPPLRIWFGHRAERFDDFARRYRRELEGREGPLKALLKAASKGDITLLYAAKDPECNHALVLRDFLNERVSAQSDR
ncbi:DUF488 domain-containing protein [Natronoglycomyces albus]|uniref:DUF488 family protein n=1 Tax=Natronoglycomyces albus TaxID=2811108 RepID=A0A895XFL8_9ACTN|nr:DUF488 family protein [Natronoglycomyces albus]QSB04641.1 DUF488 family protein [Natronoglycomyces albus]